MTPQQAHQQAAAIGDDALSRQHRTNTGGSLAYIAGAVAADLLPILVARFSRSATSSPNS